MAQKRKEARGLSVHAWFSNAVGAADGHIARPDFEAALLGEAAFYVTGTGDGSGVLGAAEKFSKQEANLLIKCVRVERARGVGCGGVLRGTHSPSAVDLSRREDTDARFRRSTAQLRGR